MGFTTRAAGLLGLFSVSLAAPAPQAGAPPSAGNNACAAVSQAQAQQMAANPQGRRALSGQLGIEANSANTPPQQSQEYQLGQPSHACSPCQINHKKQRS